MYLSRLNLSNFKNYREIDVKFSPRINCFVGDNGVGKTNILDAIHYLSLTKSYFVNVDSVNIHHGDDFFIIKGIFHNTDKDEEERVKASGEVKNASAYQGTNEASDITDREY